jgi:hypothetical protein
MKVPLLLCVVMLSAISTSAQARCTHEPVGKLLRVGLWMEDSTPIIIQNAVINGLRAIPDIEVRTDSALDVVVSVNGEEVKDTLGNVMVDVWNYRVVRLWSCGGSGGVLGLEQTFDMALQVLWVPGVEAAVQKVVATLNVKTFEKFRQERATGVPAQPPRS